MGDHVGLRDGIYSALLDDLERAKPEQVPSGLEVLLANLVDQDARRIAIAVYDAGRVLPEPGYELMDTSGEIVGMAELAWVEQPICVLTEAQAEFADAARQGGWTVWLMDDAEGSQKLIALLTTEKRNHDRVVQGLSAGVFQRAEVAPEEGAGILREVPAPSGIDG